MIAIGKCVSEQTRRCRRVILVFEIRNPYPVKGEDMITILIVLMVLMLLGAVPAWPHSQNWGYGPSGGLGLIVLILVILVLSGRL
jgi:hypothetical protein